MNGRKFIGASALAIGFVMATAGSASAVKPGSEAEQLCIYVVPDIACNGIDTGVDDLLDQLCNAIDAAGPQPDPDDDGSLKQRDRDTMVSKVIGISEKIADGKIDDAQDKALALLTKFNSLVTAPKRKISITDATNIFAELDPAKACVDGLSTE
jgi:hypothetical protein